MSFAHGAQHISIASPAIEVSLGNAAATSPVRVLANAAGFGVIARLHRDLTPHERADIVVECSKVDWIDGHLTAPLDIVFRQAALRHNFVRLGALKPALRDTFRRNRLIAERMPNTSDTVMPIRAFRTEEAVAFSAYAKRYLDRPEMPSMPRTLRSDFFEGVDELFANAALHARTVLPVVVGGQYFPRRRLLAFSIADGGEGIQPAVSAKLGQCLSPADAIDWAMEPFNTTRQGDIPGGLGSKVLREFIDLNGGRMTVVSGTGFWQQDGSDVTRRSIVAPFPGTAVLLEINTAAGSASRCASAPEPWEIW